jgi:pimeloyl-ACP methyl ester carboxylesterase
MNWTSLRADLAPREKSGPIAWRDAGKGPPVLLIHTAGLNADAWEPQIAILKQRRWVVAADLPGHGKSDMLPDGAGLDDYVAAMAGLIDALGTPPLPVIGHSLGALIALGLALDHPDKVAAVVGLCTVYCRDKLARGAVEARAAQVAKGRIDTSGPIARWFPFDRTGQLARHVEIWLRKTDPKAYAAAYRVLATADRAYEGRIRELACPSLFMAGVSDPNAPPAMSDRLAHEAPGGRSVAIPGAYHMMHLTHSMETTNAIQAFLRNVKTAW